MAESDRILTLIFDLLDSLLFSQVLSPDRRIRPLEVLVETAERLDPMGTMLVFLSALGAKIDPKHCLKPLEVLAVLDKDMPNLVRSYACELICNSCGDSVKCEDIGGVRRLGSQLKVYCSKPECRHEFLRMWVGK